MLLDETYRFRLLQFNRYVLQRLASRWTGIDATALPIGSNGRRFKGLERRQGLDELEKLERWVPMSMGFQHASGSAPSMIQHPAA